MDIKRAFLYAPVSREVYIEIPPESKMGDKVYMGAFIRRYMALATRLCAGRGTSAKYWLGSDLRRAPLSHAFCSTGKGTCESSTTWMTS